MSEFKEKARQELITFVQNSGVSRSESEVAIDNCVNEIGRKAEKGFATGGIIAAFMHSRQRGIGAVTAIGVMAAATSITAAMTIKNSQHCSELRDAIVDWRSGKTLKKEVDDAFQLP